MNFRYSKYHLQGREQFLQRALEILPGAISWSILLGMLILSFWKPILAAAIVIAFDLYWILRIFYMTLFLLLASLQLSLERTTDWLARVRAVDHPDRALQDLERAMVQTPLVRRIPLLLHRQALRQLARHPHPPPRSEEIFHLIILPMANEGREIVEPGLRSLAQQTFPSHQILIVLAVEARADLAIQRAAEELQRAYRGRFLDCLITRHPDGLPGEARVKGANATYAAREAARYFEARAIPFDHVIASCFDADTVVSREYVACLTYHYLIAPDRTRASFQPIPVYHNNIWEVPAFARVLDIGSSFMQLVEATNPEKLVTFSSHSMGFHALVDVGYWPVDMISDDSAIFWKAFLHYDGRYRVIPMYITLSMDIAAAGSWWRTALNVYRQKRRWAWGVENFPIVMRGFLRAKRISLSTKVRHTVKMLEGHVTWATGAFLVSVLGWLPAIVAGREFSGSVLYYSGPRIQAIIFQLASLSLVTTILLSLSLLPKQTTRRSLRASISHAIEWLFVPLIFICFSALPALDAQTRLLLGKRMEFWVTEKRRRQ